MNYWIIPGQKEIKYTNLIQQLCAEKFGVSIEAMRSKYRYRHFCYSRHAYFYIRRKTTGLSLAAIGKELGKSHATVINSIRVAKDLIFSDRDFSKKINEILAIAQLPRMNLSS